MSIVFSAKTGFPEYIPDDAGKQELDAHLFARASRCVVDSISQCVLLGESHDAIEAGIISEADLVEFGSIIGQSAVGCRLSAVGCRLSAVGRDYDD